MLSANLGVDNKIKDQYSTLRSTRRPWEAKIVKPSTSTDTPPVADDLALRSAEVHQALDEILESTPFRASKQSQALLRYIVSHTLAGRGELLRERVIGVEVFGRKPDYDTGNDPIVRARAAEVRKRLAQYYLSSEHHPISVRIDIPPGSYKASFEWRADASADSHTPSEAAAQTVCAGARLQAHEARRSSLRRGLIAAGIAMACLSAILLLRLLRTPQQNAFEQFWSPVLNSRQPVLIYTGTNVVYGFRSEFVKRYAEGHRLQNHGEQFPLNLGPGQKIDASDLSIFPDGFITTQDAIAGYALIMLLARHHRPYELRYGHNISFGDFLSRPSILIGAFDNRWTLELTDGLRFVFEGGDRIVDRSDKQRAWVAGGPRDYAIVSRLQNSETQGVLITIAGIGANGTQAAAEFLTDRKQISLLARKAPPDWSRKNMQVVLHTTVVENNPSAPDIVATYCW
jgi:hypothetical protein